MALTYLQSANLMKDVDFVARLKVAVLKFAGFILDESSATAGHSSRISWARQVISGPESIAQSTAPWVVMDVQVQLDGALITDTALQAALETQVLKII